MRRVEPLRQRRSIVRDARLLHDVVAEDRCLIGGRCHLRHVCWLGCCQRNGVGAGRDGILEGRPYVGCITLSECFRVLDGEDNIGRVEDSAVVELHPLAKGILPTGEVSIWSPAHSQARDDRPVRRHVGECLVNLLRDFDGRGGSRVKIADRCVPLYHRRVRGHPGLR